MRTKNIETTIQKKSADIRFTIRLALVTELNVFDVFLRVAHFATCMHRVEPGPSMYVVEGWSFSKPLRNLFTLSGAGAFPSPGDFS